MITTPVAVTIHIPCGHPVLTGWAEGLRATADPVALNHTGLIAAILAGRTLYRLTRTGLVELDADRLRGGSVRGPTVAAHKCGQPIPAEHRETTTPTVVEMNEPERIPF